MLLIKPLYGDLKRLYQPSIFLQYRLNTTNQQSLLLIDINHIQCDNQLLNNHTTPIIFYFNTTNNSCLQILIKYSTSSKLINEFTININSNLIFYLNTTYLQYLTDLYKFIEYIYYNNNKVVQDKAAQYAKQDLKILYCSLTNTTINNPSATSATTTMIINNNINKWKWKIHNLKIKSFEIQLHCYAGLDYLKNCFDIKYHRIYEQQQPITIR